MASFKRYTGTLGDASWPSGFTTIYTVPSGQKSVITGLTVCNTTEFELPVSIRLTAGDSEFADRVMLAPLDDMSNNTFYYYPNQILYPAEPIRGSINTNTTLDFTRKKFGLASARFDGTANLSFTDDVSFGLPNDFTIEFWFYTDALPATDPVYPLSKTASALGTSGTWSLGMPSTGAIAFIDNSGGTEVSIGVLGTVTAATWHHIAISRSGATLRGFLDGALGFTVTNSTNWSNTEALLVGTSAFGTSPNITGNIQDLRITKDVARYTSAFTRPAKAFSIQESPRSFLSDVHVPSGKSIKVLTAEKVVLEGDDAVQGTAPLIDGAGSDTYDVWLSVYEDV